MAERRLVFGLLGGGAGSKTSWLFPDAKRGDATDVDRLIRQAQIAEEAKIDVYFLADGLGFDKQQARNNPVGGLEPLTALSAVAHATHSIGLVPTASTSFNHPYNLARRLASLDHISRGRAGWNIVTSSGGHENYGWSELPAQEERYDRAREFVDVVLRLWDSWEPDAVVFDQEQHRYADPDKIHAIDHRGKHFSVAGPLNIQPTPQGRPVLFQAGSSRSGKQFGAEVAEVIYTAQGAAQDARGFRREIRDEARRLGRDADRVLVLPGLSPIVGSTEDEALAIEAELLAHTDYETARRQLEVQLGGADLSGIELDDRIPVERLPDTSQLRARQSRPEVFRRYALDEDHTLRDVIDYLTRAHGHGTFRGTPLSVATHIRDWFETGASDGFILMPPGYPDSLRSFTEQVVPILQDWGIYQAAYGDGTLRERLGLIGSDVARAV